MKLEEVLGYIPKEELGKITYKEYKPIPLADQQQAIDEENKEDDSTKPVAAKAPTIAPMYFYHPDHLGTNTALTDFNGNAYQFFINLPFGETMAQQLGSNYYTSPYKFNGKELDEETGFYYYGARYYDPRISVWMSVDPLAEIAPNKSPYHYCSNNPVNRIDPTGLTDYTVNGETRTINDCHNDVTMKVSEKQFDKLQNKFDKGGARYERYMNRLSVKNGFTTSSLYADSEVSSGVGISLAQHKAGGDSYSDWSLNNTISEKLTKGNDIAGALLDASFNGNSAAGVLSKQAGYQLSAYKLGVAIQNDKQTYGYQSQVATGQVVGGIAGGATGAYIGQEIGGWICGGIGFLCGGMGAFPGVLIGKAVGGAIGAYFGSDYGSDYGKEKAIQIGEIIEK